MFDNSKDYDLARNLIEFENYISIKEDVWSKLLAIYSGGPSIQRIYPKIYDNTVLKVKIDRDGLFMPGTEKHNSSDKKYVRDYGKGREREYACFYRCPGKNKWSQVK